MAQGRCWSVVIHDVPPQAKELCHSVLKKLAKSYMIALEPYDEETQKKSSPTGFHLHLFYELKSPSPKTRQLKKWEDFKWGRVQVDPKHKNATKADQQVYLTNPNKNKTCDPSPIIFPNNQADYCGCKPPWLYQADLKSFEKYSRKCDELHDLMFGSQDKIQDWAQYEEDTFYMSECRRRSLELLMKWNYPCSKCGLRRAFFSAQKKSQPMLGDDGSLQATTAPPEEIGGEAQGAKFWKGFFSQDD